MFMDDLIIGNMFQNSSELLEIATNLNIRDSWKCSQRGWFMAVRLAHEVSRYTGTTE